MSSTEKHVAILAEGVEAWNRWRSENPDVRPRLEGEDLSELDLTDVNLQDADLQNAVLFDAVLRHSNLKMATLADADLSGAELAQAELYKADLDGSFLTGANLEGAYLAEASIDGADLRGAVLRKAQLHGASLVEADLKTADLTGADLTDARLERADLSHANLAQVNLIGTQYGDFQSMRGNYYGIRGLDSSFGNALFVRDAQDHDYLDSFERSIARETSPWRRRVKEAVFAGWRWIDYGRSLSKPFLYAIVLALLFGVLYLADMRLDWGLMDYSGSSESWLTPFYYSIVTYTTLGFGDITPKNWIGEVVVIAEVVLGYTTLGLLLAILASKVARRS